MTLAEVWPTVHALSREEKRLLLEALSADLARDELLSLIDPKQVYEVWSPYDAFEAAATLLRFLEESRQSE